MGERYTGMTMFINKYSFLVIMSLSEENGTDLFSIDNLTFCATESGLGNYFVLSGVKRIRMTLVVV